jgi:hypothetical protein
MNAAVVAAAERPQETSDRRTFMPFLAAGASVRFVVLGAAPRSRHDARSANLDMTSPSGPYRHTSVPALKPCSRLADACVGLSAVVTERIPLAMRDGRAPLGRVNSPGQVRTFVGRVFAALSGWLRRARRQAPHKR